MEFDITPWINLVIRWLHFITGIAWIGSSFYFVWLDNHLEEPKEKKNLFKNLFKKKEQVASDSTQNQ